jgi:hypothetical protein
VQGQTVRLSVIEVETWTEVDCEEGREKKRRDERETAGEQSPGKGREPSSRLLEMLPLLLLSWRGRRTGGGGVS